MNNRSNISLKNTMNNLGIVVIVPTYNNEKTLADVINGIKDHSQHIIVINDGSTDNTSQILENISDIQVIAYDKNRGKGYALKKGLTIAKELGFKYAITIDSDGQHSPSDIPVFVEEIKKEPEMLLIGARNLEANNMPYKNTFANKFSNFWFRLETGIKLTDTQSGYRLYPLDKIGKMKYYTTKYEFELELIVFLAWKGVKVKNVPINIYYQPEGERVSHFRPFRDFTRISILNTILVLITFLWILPFKFFRDLTWRNINIFVKRQIIYSKDTNLQLTFAIMLGIFMGIVPIWGYQMIVAIFIANFLKLNKVIVLVASNISIPPFMPFLLYGSYVTGCIVTDTPINLSLKDVSLDGMKLVLFQYLLGSIIFAVLCCLLIGSLSWIFMLLFRKDRKIVEE